VAEGPVLVGEAGGVGGFVVVEVEGEEFSVVVGADGGVETGEEVKAEVEGFGGEGIGGEFVGKVQGSAFDHERDVDVHLLVVVVAH
jgi:hypothetical protein